jgi:hypothetical protein
VFGALAEFERQLVAERSRAGVAAAKARGARLGRRPVMTAVRRDPVREMHASGRYTAGEIAATVGGIPRDPSTATCRRQPSVRGRSVSFVPAMLGTFRDGGREVVVASMVCSQRTSPGWCVLVLGCGAGQLQALSV